MSSRSPTLTRWLSSAPGVQGTYQLRSLAGLRPLRCVWVYDLVPERAEAFARSFSQSMSEAVAFSVETAPSVSAAVRQAGIVLVATWSRAPFIVPGMLAPGAHVTTLGPDEPGKAEVAAEVIQDSLFVCDDRNLAVELGALRGVGLGAEAVDAELGEVFGGSHPGRTSSDQITIYGGIGLAFQDAVAAWHVYEAAKTRGIGSEIDFLA
jgi:ornithine cyclodeaminase/alanine dehydrogenase-like protein (mu-crystallin family)